MAYARAARAHPGELVAMVVRPSDRAEETASLSAFEALAAARPLLVSNRGALPELVATGAGLSSRPGDEVDLAEKIGRFMRDEDLCRRASTEAGRLAEEMITPQRHIADLEAVYRGIPSLV